MTDYLQTPEEYETEKLREWTEKKTRQEKKYRWLKKHPILVAFILSVLMLEILGAPFALIKTAAINSLSEVPAVFIIYISLISIILAIVFVNKRFSRFLDSKDKGVQAEEQIVQQEIQEYRIQYQQEQDRAAQMRQAEIEEIDDAMTRIQCFQLDVLPFINALYSGEKSDAAQTVYGAVDSNEKRVLQAITELNDRAKRIGYNRQIAFHSN